MSDRLAERVLLIGWDGAEPSLIQPLLEAGLMPNLQRLIDAGASGKIISVQPMLSAVTWTSVATGKWPWKHGILGGTEPDPASGGIRRAASTSRSTKALWNVLTQNGLRTNLIGWRGAHPAEPIAGINVTDLHAVATVEQGKPWPQPEGSFHPPEIAAAIADLRLHPSRLDPQFLSFFVPKLAKVDLREVRRMTHLARVLGATVSNHAVATWAMQQGPWDLTAVCYSGIEQLQHAFADHLPPRPRHVPPEEFELYQHVIPACYRFHDQMLGRLLELAGEGATVILLSDHGFKTSAMHPAATSQPDRRGDDELRHRRLGICVMRGPGVRRGAAIAGATLHDVAPTVLALLGLPIGADVDGRPWIELLHPPPEPKWIESWDPVPGASGSHPPGADQPHQELRSMLDELREMGYHDPQEEQLAAQEEVVRVRNRFNLARSLIEAGRAQEAVPVLEELAAKSPRSTSVASMLVEVYFVTGRLAELRQYLQRWVPGEADEPLVALATGRLELAEGRPAAALEWLSRAAVADADNPRVHVFAGNAHLCLRQWQPAQRAFERAIQLDADHAEALHGLAVVAIRQGRHDDAVTRATASISAHPSLAAAHYHLGVALGKLGRPSEAADAFERALALDPAFRAARRACGAFARVSTGAGDTPPCASASRQSSCRCGANRCASPS